MRRVVLFLFFFNTTFSFASVPTPSAVSSFFDSMKRLSKATNYRESEEITSSMKKQSYLIRHGSASGENMRNDFQPFSYDERSPSHNDIPLGFALYIDKLQKYIYEDKVMNVDYRVLHNDYYGEAIDYSNGNMTSQKTIVKTIVEKTYTINYQTITFVDTLLTHIPTNTIFKFYNIEVSNDKDIKDLKRQAARYFLLKQYEDAYTCFEKILSINANEGESLYRLGLMTYYGKGCKKRHKKGVEYMIRASESDMSFGFKDKAETVLFNWKYGSGIM